MNRRGIIVLSVLLLVAVSAGMKVLHDRREEARRTRARAEIDEIRKAIGIWRTMVRPMPESLDELRRGRPLTQADADALMGMNSDPWGHPYGLTVHGPDSCTITCFGADGAPGGEGADEDIVVQLPAAKGRTSR